MWGGQMAKPHKSKLPIVIVATLGVCLVLLVIASAVVAADPNETWSGWVGAIGTIAAIMAGWIVVIYEREEEDTRVQQEKDDIAAVVGWRIFGDVIEVMVLIRLQFRQLLHFRRTMRERHLAEAECEFSGIVAPPRLLSAWPEFRYFPGQIGPTLAQALGQIETFNHVADIKHPVPLSFIEEQARMLVQMRRSLRGAHNDLSKFLEQDRLRRLESPSRAGDRHA